MNNEIRLVFDKATTRLAGNPYGRNVFDEQARDKIDYSTMNTIVFPNTIEKVASSFTQGFFSAIIEKIGYSNFDNVISIKACTEALENTIHKDLFV